MLTSIVRCAIRLRGVVISLACMLAGYGIYTLYNSGSSAEFVGDLWLWKLPKCMI